MKPFKFLFGLLLLCAFALTFGPVTATTWDGGPGVTIVTNDQLLNASNAACLVEETVDVELNARPFRILNNFLPEAIGSNELIQESYFNNIIIRNSSQSNAPGLYVIPPQRPG